jgi:catechol 2,3-dioxygenase-like lactoylglutathione lyase family enzyme
MGHWHLNSQNVEGNRKLFVALGGKAIKPGDFEIVNFPGVSVFLHQRPFTPAPTGGTAGTVINHVGLIVPNVQDAVARWRVAGVPVEFGRDPVLGKDRIDQAWITTVDGLRVEILEDKSQTEPIKHHHVHYHLNESAIPAIQAWYAKHFGAKPGMRGRNQAADIPGVNLTFTKSDTPTIPTKGRVLDHIGFDVKDLDAFAKKLEANGVKLTQPVVRRPDGSALAFTQDEWGASIELNERPNPL